MKHKSIPILDLKAQYSTIKNEIHVAIERVLESQQFILGVEVEALEKILADYCQCKFACGVSSGTDALLLALGGTNRAQNNCTYQSHSPGSSGRPGSQYGSNYGNC